MKKILSIFLVLSLILCTFTGCNGNSGAVRISLNSKSSLEKTLFLNNQCDVTYDGAGTGSSPWFTTNLEYAEDPYCAFNFTEYLNLTGHKGIKSEEYPFIVLKIKTKNCNDNSFTLFANVAGNLFPDAGISKSSFYDNTTDDWCYVMFDFSGFGMKGDYSFFRFDFEKTATTKGEACCVAEMIFMKTEGEALKYLKATSSGHEFTAAERNELDKLFAQYKAEEPAAYTSYKAVKAPAEDSGLALKFKDSFTRTAEDDASAGGSDTYCMYLAKNELEACQLVLTASESREGLTVEVTDFVLEDGTEKLPVSVFEGTYFEVEGENVIDPLPPLSGSFGIEKGKSKSLVIKTGTEPASKEGTYRATVSVKNSAGETVKQADIFAHVWNFELPEETSCKTLMDLSWFSIYSYHECYEGDDGVLYQKYYDFLLENRICSYNLPYTTFDGLFTDERILPYLDNPRVTAFQPLGFKTDLNNENVSASYNYLSQKPEWLKKAYFYPVDEPLNTTMLDSVNRNGAILKENFPGYKMIIPMHYTEDLSGDGSVDYFEYVKDTVNVWCPHNFFYSTWKDYQSNPKTYICMTPLIEKKLGEFPERMKKEQEGGDEVWWYVTRVPNGPEATVLINCEGVGSRELFWLQKLYNIDGFLYYLTNDWAFKENNYGVDPKFEIVNGTVKSYGNGVLLYCGKPYGIYGPVGSLRLEIVRDGIEDFEYLTMLKSFLGEEKVDLVIRSLATSLTEWNSDAETFTKTRISLGNMLEELYNK